MAKVDLPEKLAFVDIETTGGRANFDRVIEIGVVRVEKKRRYRVAKTYQTLIYPGQHVPPEILSLTGIGAGELEKAPYFREVKDEILEVLDDCVLVAHNVRFDYGFLKQEFRRFGVDFSPKHFCSVKLSRALFPEFRHHNLDAIIDRFGIECGSRHRAFDDAQVVWRFFETVLKRFGAGRLIELIDKVMRRPSLPSKLALGVIESLPELPGVYIFYGENGVVLYVGKSKNIKERVLSHFSSDIRSSKEMAMASQVVSIETKVCAGELGALILESSLIKELQPLYNRMLRLCQQIVVLKAEPDRNGYLKAQVSTCQRIEAEEIDQIYAVFKSLKSAKESLHSLAKEYGLCLTKLGLEPTKSGCFSYRLGQCKGACLAKEPVKQYNLRFMTAFLKLKFRAWPFRGPIVITEQGFDDSLMEQFLIDKWCYLGSVKNDQQLINENLKPVANFDLDIYKIVNSYLKSPKNLKNIRAL